jgi:phosphatidylglycerol---prolipoprotein diacylglyceryl transferase
MTIPYPRIPPEIFRVGPVAVRWYGVMYLVGYLIGIAVAKRRVRRGLVPFNDAAVDSLVGYLVVGMLLGARLFYVFIYDRAHYFAKPLDALAIWHGGLSFHGAMLGMAIACLVFARRHRVPFWSVADTVTLAAPPGLFFGRIGNFINGELYGRATDVPWAMIFPTDPLQTPRHPSQLYEALGEGAILFFLLLALERRAVRGGWYRQGLLSGGFLVGYGLIRYLIEFTRQPDAQLGFVAGPFSMGQILSALMILIGFVVIAVAYRRPSPQLARNA